MGVSDPEPDTDAGWIIASRADPDVFAVIFERHVGSISRFIGRQAVAADVEDLVAETFITAYRVRASYDPTRPHALPWLYGIAVNVLRHYARDRARHVRILERVEAWSTPENHDDEDLAALLSRIDLQADRRIAAALAELDETSRHIMLLLAVGLSYPEIADAVGVPLGTVRSRISRREVGSGNYFTLSRQGQIDG